MREFVNNSNNNNNNQSFQEILLLRKCATGGKIVGGHQTGKDGWIGKDGTGLRWIVGPVFGRTLLQFLSDAGGQ